MSKSKQNRRRRGSGGHPAKVAAKREQDEARRQQAAAESRVMRAIFEDAAALQEPLAAELMASSLLGTFWLDRDELLNELEEDVEEETDWTLAFGLPVVERVARRGGPGTVPLLRAFAQLEPGALGARADALVGELTARGEPVPEWTAELGELTYRRAATVREGPYDDAAIVLIEAEDPAGRVHGVGALIDATLGEVATDLMVVDSIEAVERNLKDDEDAQVAGARVEELAVGVAGAWVAAAMRMTDLTQFPLFTDEYPELRALVLARADACAEGLPPFAEVPSEEQRAALLAEFLAAPEGEGITEGSAAVEVVEGAIACCADDVDGRPLRWSPSLVGVFVEEWAPRAFGERPELIAAVPAALEAWVRYAGRRSELTEEAISDTLAAIANAAAKAGVTAAMSPEEMDDFVEAAEDYGIDLDDGEALRRFAIQWGGDPAADEPAAAGADGSGAADETTSQEPGPER